jgi:hypothetical protein
MFLSKLLLLPETRRATICMAAVAMNLCIHPYKYSGFTPSMSMEQVPGQRVTSERGYTVNVNGTRAIVSHIISIDVMTLLDTVVVIWA